MFDMRLGRFRSVVHCMFVMTAGQVCMMSCRLLISRFVMFSGLLMVSCRVFVMLCCLVVMISCLFRHDFPPSGCQECNRVKSATT
jgi:hypothetical protein